jgi:hypothetical protein
MSGSGRSGHLLLAALPARMGGPTRRRIFGDRVRGAKISAVHAREQAKKAAPEPMEGFGGPAQPSPTIAQCLNGGYGWLEVMAIRIIVFK